MCGLVQVAGLAGAGQSLQQLGGLQASAASTLFEWCIYYFLRQSCSEGLLVSGSHSLAPVSALLSHTSLVSSGCSIGPSCKKQ